MKKIIILLFAALFVLILLAGCAAPKKDGSKLVITAAAFPEYDWIRVLTAGNDNIELNLLLDKGVDLHSYRPTAPDIVTIADSDVFVYVGGESEGWADTLVKSSQNKELVCIPLLSALGEKAKLEEEAEGMQHNEEGEEEEEEEEEYDEHIWLSLKNAAYLCDHIVKKLCEIDPQNKDLYESNLKTYKEKLSELDGKYEAAVSIAKKKTLLFADRFPFRYLVDDYGLSYYAAFSGCSAESEASFETIIFLASKVDELGLDTIIKIETSDGKLAETVKNSTKSKNQKTVTLNSLQSVTLEMANGGTTYISVMEKNLEALKEALG